jgi:sulfur carrier protein ThiS
MHVHLGGHLAFYDRAKRTRFEVHLAAETALLDLIRELGVPEAEIALAAVNRTVVSLSEAQLVDGDRLDLYPPMSGGAKVSPRPACRSRASGPVVTRLLRTVTATPRRR